MVTLKRFVKEDFQVLSSWFEDEKSLGQWGGGGLGSTLSIEDMLDMLREENTHPKLRICRQAFNEKGEAVGHIQIAFDHVNGVGRIARFVVAPNMRGKGYGCTIMKAALNQLFSDSSVQRAELNVFTWNSQAINLYLKLGFIAEGVRRSSVLVGGARWDTYFMGLLRADWSATYGQGS